MGVFRWFYACEIILSHIPVPALGKDKNRTAARWPHIVPLEAQWLSGRVLGSRLRGCGFKPHRRHCIVILEQDTLLVQPRKTRPCLTERLLMGRKESNQTKKTKTSFHDFIAMIKCHHHVASQRIQDFLEAFCIFYQYKMRYLVVSKNKHPLFV